MCEKNGFNTHFYELDARLGLGNFTKHNYEAKQKNG